MGRTNKVRRWVVDGEKHKLKWYVQKRKGKVDLSQLRLDDKGRTALHLACKHQQHGVITYLLHQRVDCLVQDFKGNVPLLLAARAKKKEKQVYYDIALALLEACASALYVANHRGQSANQWFEHFGLNKDTEMPNKSKPGDQHFSGCVPDAETLDSEWADKLQDECESEYFQHWGNYEQDFNDEFTSAHRESYDAWAERITSEFHARKRYCGPQYSSPKRRTKKSTWSSANQAEFEWKVKQDDEHRLESKKRKEADKLKRKKHKYEILCEHIFGAKISEEIRLSHLPQASENFLAILLSNLQDDPGQVKLYLREQQIKWHPDKFVQKCGQRLSPYEREPILDRVKQLSQILNGYLENV